MPFDETPEGSGDSFAAWCNACRQPISRGEPMIEIEFPSDPHGSRGLSGPYHRRCSKPFVSLARAARMIPGG